MSIRKGGQIIAGTPTITTGHHVGEIFWTSRLDNELSGAVDADGAIYSVEAFTGEKSVPELLRKGSLPSVSLEEYESIVSANGSCRAWGWDNGDTFRVPTLKDVYLMAGQAESAGEFISESLPNITGGFGAYYNGNANGAFRLDSFENINRFPSGTGGGNRDQYSFDASRSSSAYQDGAKVRPDSVRYRAMVQIVTGVKEDASQLKEYKFNNPHFFGQSMWTDVDPKNGSWLVSNGSYHSGKTYVDYYKWLLKIYNKTETVEGVSVKGVSDEYTDYDFIINTADTTFRLPLVSERVLVAKKEATTEDQTWYNLYSDGWLEQGGRVINESSWEGSTALLREFNDTNYSVIATVSRNGFNSSTDGYNYFVTAEPVSSNSFLWATVGHGGTQSFRAFQWFACGYAEIPTETEYTEVKGLYFYVGDTLQDPSVINVGVVLDYFSKIDTVHCVVDTFESGSSWYRVYDDGWVEQGGTLSVAQVSTGQQISLLKNFKDTNYSVIVCLRTWAASWAGEANPRAVDATISSFKIQSGGNNSPSYMTWVACGYGA